MQHTTNVPDACCASVPGLATSNNEPVLLCRPRSVVNCIQPSARSATCNVAQTPGVCYQQGLPYAAAACCAPVAAAQHAVTKLACYPPTVYTLQVVRLLFRARLLGRLVRLLARAYLLRLIQGRMQRTRGSDV